MKAIYVAGAACALACALALLAGGCSRKQAAQPGRPVTPTAGGGGTVQATPAIDQNLPQSPFQMAQYVEPSFPTQVEDYSVAAGFSNVANWKQFGKVFDPQQQQRLARDLFVVLPADRHQMSFIYEENNYASNPSSKDIPSFVTTDSVLHTFHVFYDYLLRSVEVSTLYDAASQMTRKLLEGSVQQYQQQTDPQMQQAALKNVAYLLVPATALGVKTDDLPVPPDARSLAAAEMALVRSHQGAEDSPLFGYKIDYSQFVPRGHYTRSDRLKSYFVAMMWYGFTPVLVRDSEGKTRPEQIRQAALLGKLLTASYTTASTPGALWLRIYEPTAFLVGVSDDYNMAGLGRSVDRVIGSQPLDKALADEGNLSKIVDDASQHSPAQIVNGLKAKEIPVKLMGQRFVVDSYLFQQLVYPSVGDEKNPRGFPMGLDVLSALGSDRALEILKTQYKQDQYANYDAQMQAMRQYIGSVQPATWQENVYWGWIDVVRRVAEPKGKGYPSFMQNTAWKDKSLNTALGSWAELRHDTILYAKQSTAECGEGGEDEKNLPPKGYVEPDVRAYDRLRFLHTQLWKGLKSRGFLDDTLDGKCKEFDDLLGFLVTTARKELANVGLTPEDEETIRNYGDTMTRLNLFTQEVQTTRGGQTWSEITSETDRDMAVVADVHTNIPTQEALEEGVGHANEIWVVFPARGKLWVGRGAVFSYYEFKHPISDRLTDESWQQMLSGPNRPVLPAWVKSFTHPKGVKVKDKIDDRVLENTRSTGGC